ncbi:hypothetical protein HY641_03705 [Candidatus Woesearchaeota archaeon]|nr:hypothetical protein [Candidatus Woesearchaeota archaeon]
MTWLDDWPELGALALILIGALLAISSSGLLMTLLIAFACGSILARLAATRPEDVTRMGLLTLAALIGILLGTNQSLLTHTIAAYAIGYGASTWIRRHWTSHGNR